MARSHAAGEVRISAIATPKGSAITKLAAISCSERMKPCTSQSWYCPEQQGEQVRIEKRQNRAKKRPRVRACRCGW
jgi:hypothetical protein